MSDTKDVTGPDLFDPTVLADPFDYYARLRTDEPVRKLIQPGRGRDIYVVTSHELVVSLLKNVEDFSSQFLHVLHGGAAVNPEAAAVYKTGFPLLDVMLTTDGEQHARFRGLVNKAFSPRRIKAMTSFIESATDHLIDAFIERGKCDFLAEFAVPLPLYMISDILGIDRKMMPQLHGWSDAYVLRGGQMATSEQEVGAARSIVECQKFLNGLIHERRRDPRDDMISDLVTSELEGVQRLNDLEILSIIQQLLVAGNETTRNLLVGFMAQILTNPAQLQLISNDPSLIGNAIEESLRTETPASATWRITTRDVMFGGVAIPKGAIVMARLDAASRDAKVFGDGETFNAQRKNASGHVAFGIGPHFCVGHTLARHEMQIAVSKLLARLKNIHLIADKSDLGTVPRIHIRGRKALWIGFDPGQRVN